MSILRICACAVVTISLAVVIKKDVPVIALLLCAAFGTVLIINVLPYIKSAAELFSAIDNMQTAGEYFAVILKITGIAWAAQLTSQLCSDMGYGYIGSKVELAGKIMIISYSLPILGRLIKTIQAIL